MRALAALLALSIALAGCNSDGGGGDDDPTPTASGSTSATGTGSVPTLLLANLTADTVNGTAPLAVNFTVGGTGAITAWRLAFGDGNSTNGTSVPAVANHTYLVGGNFTATLTVTGAGNGTGTASLNLTVAVPTGRALPDVMAFEFGESLGCAGDAHSLEPTVPLNCVSYQGGPDASGIDGHWLPLDERYWGLAVTAVMEEPSGEFHDTDCVFTAADESTEVGEANNGSDPCTGLVPEGTAWMFLYPYANPATAMTVTFSVPTA